MVIGGLQKFSLVDFPGMIAAIVFSRGCGFRCPYCHNPELVDPKKYAEAIPQGAVMDFLAARKGQLQGVVVTGGEPTLHADLPDFLTAIRGLGFATKLDTNGSNPDMLFGILERGLVDYVAMDIKAPLASYGRLVAAPVRTQDIKRSISLIIESGVTHEFRTTYLEPELSVDDMREIALMVRGCRLFVVQSFRPTATLDQSYRSHPSPSAARMEEMRAMLEATGVTVTVR
ncbi:MAG: anaerobic ribonucleoside-triphosphate reductase activating protein [Spirochaetia bacterium]|jgi:pyruvate formate lyase activating enzyme